MAKDTMFMEELTDQELEQVNGGCYSSCGYYGGGYYYAAVGYGYSC